MPFTITLDTQGALLHLAPLLRKVWGLDSEEDLNALRERLCLSRPFAGRLQREWLDELTGMIIHLHLEGTEGTVIRGQIYETLTGWIFTGFPRISAISELETLGVQLSQLPLHSAIGELLIANEASNVSLAEAQLQASRITESNETLEALNERFERFVPTAILENIGIESPLDVELGRYVETEKAVMFTDLRNFTTLSEKLEAPAIFAVINQYLSCTVPSIEEHGGYVVQYLGDGIMALFPGGTAQAIHAGVAMQNALQDYLRSRPDFPHDLRMSIGIHEGPVALGIVGNKTRWDASIIADAVNTSARIESMTRVLGGEIIVSREYLERTGQADTFETRELGAHQIRGRAGQLELVEILNSLEPDERHSRELTRKDFSGALQSYRDGDLYAAMSNFSRVLSMVPSDHAAQYYLGRISQRLQDLPA
jgi:class 3 adenylate cyclase